MVRSLSSSEPAGPLTTTNSYGNLNPDPSPMGSTSAPTSLRGMANHTLANPLTGSGMEMPIKVDERREKEASDDESGSSDSCSSSSGDESHEEVNEVDASWVELTTTDLPSVDGNKIAEKFDNLLTSLSKIDVGTSVGPSLNPGFAEVEAQLIQLREDNLKLLSILEATNEAMKKSLTYAHELKNELKSSHDEYDSLRSSADSVIVQLRNENERLRSRVNDLEADRNAEPVVYHQFDLSKEMNMQEMSSQIASRDIKISQMAGEIRSLSSQLEKARSELSSRSGSQQSLHRLSPPSSLTNQQQLTAFNKNQPSLMSPNSYGHLGTSAATGSGAAGRNDENQRNSLPSEQSFQQTMIAELNLLRSMVDKLTADKKKLEEKLNGRRHHRSSRHHRRSNPMGTSYTANTEMPSGQNMDQQQQQPGCQFGNGNNMETDPDDSHHHHGRHHRRHHRPHSSKGLRRLEKKLARTALPIINSAVMFKGFTTFSTQPQ